jgi:FdrA protein
VPDQVVVRPSAYYDSVVLMAVSRDVAAHAGVTAAAVVMGTPVNLGLLERQGFSLPSPRPGPNDLVLALRAEDGDGLGAAITLVDERLSARSAGGQVLENRPRSTRSAVGRRQELSLALVSVPGPSAAYEVGEALAAGLHVFCFSGGISLADEALLKQRALESGLLLLGPECGTAIVDGVGLGFANAVAPGPVGIVGASGTGIQEIACLLDLAGVGVSQAIGVGGRDLSAQVGGAMTVRALELLAEDEATEVIVVVSKPPGPGVAERIEAAAGEAGKPVVTELLGPGSTLEAAAERATALIGGTFPAPPTSSLHATPGALRGLFSGGTLCTEAMIIATEALGSIYSNVPLRPEWTLVDFHASRGHTFIDFGDEEFTDRRAHPMIDPSLRLERLDREASDPEVGVVLLDVVLGRGAHPNPAEVFAPAVEAALSRRPGGLTVVASLCGTAADPQGLDVQAARLEEAGALVMRGTARATRVALGAAGAR